jgi:DNA polymerase-1
MSKTTKDKKVLVLLDSHAILHRAYHALPDFSSTKGEPTGALYGLCLMLFAITEKFSPSHIAACFDLPKPTYRHHAYAAYKAGRVKSDDALVTQINRAREVFKVFNIPLYEKEGFEADDMLGTIVTQVKRDIPIVIASGDMDTLQLADKDHVSIFTLKKGVKDTVLYNEKAVFERFGFDPEFLPDYKGLRGDPSDNIIGVPGIGDKTATILICKYHTIEKMYKALKKDRKNFAAESGVTERIAGILEEHEEDALFSKMLATIRRDAPVEFSLEGSVWNPAGRMPEIKALFTDLEFRSLIPRAQSLFNNGAPSVEYDDPIEVEEESKVPDEDTLSDEDRELFKKAAVMLWIIDSAHTTPSIDEIFTYTKAKSLTEAHDILLQKLESEPTLLKVWNEIELPLMPVIKHMEVSGVKIDTDNFKKLSKNYEKELRSLESQIWKHAGKEFNVNSPRQLGEVLYQDLGLGVKVKKTSTGAQSTKESELEKIKDAHPIVSCILEYRELQKLLSTYIDVIPSLVNPDDSRLHATFLQAGSTTGRLSSANPNMQNIPIKSERGRAIRDGFVADKGYQLLECDYSQIELRVAAFLSNDPLLIDIFKSGRDVHTEVAAQVFKVSPEEVTKDMRRKAKVINFGILYGMGVNALKANLGTSRAEAQEFYTKYFETFNRLATYLEETKEFAAKHGYTETFFGRRRYFAGLKSPLPFIRAGAERMAINAPIQGTEADIIKLAMIDIHNDLVKKHEGDIKLVMQIHDSLIFEVKESKATEFAKEVKRAMEASMPAKDTRGVPILVDVAIGPHWGDMKRVA